MRTLLALASGALAGAASPGCGGKSSSRGGDDGSAGEPTSRGGDSGSGGSGSATVGGTASAGTPSGGTSTGGVASGGTATAGTSGVVCEQGPAAEVCGTLDELEDYVANYPGEANNPPRPEFTECPPREVIWDPFTCCNPADSGPEQRGKLCCYGFCESNGCCGRAFSVPEGSRVASTMPRRDWMSDAALDGELEQGRALDPYEAHVIGQLWSRDAQMEHASVASFARYTLELLALGAPAHLVEAAQRAALDEIEHARLCFGVASRFLGSPAGPATLDLTGAEPRTSLAAAAAAAVLEGCVGETIAALVAREQRARSSDASIVRVLERIADDEARHASLAFDFVAWALSVGGSETRRAVELSLADGIARAVRGPATCGAPLDAALLNHYGRLSATQERRATLRAIEDVIVPCARELLSVPRNHARAVLGSARASLKPVTDFGFARGPR